MVVSLKEIFDEASRDVKFDAQLAKRITQYVGDLMNRNHEHVMFFGSNLTGVYPLRFKTSDKNEWFIDIKDIDEIAINRRVAKESGLKASWVRATDVFNLDCLYTAHRFLNSSLPEKEKTKAVNDTFMALNIKLMGSLMAWYFRYDVDERTAQEVYARLSRKFYIKKYGSWRKVLEVRAEDVCAPTSKWLPVIKSFTNHEQIAQCISDIQGRLRSMLKYIWEVFAEVHAEASKFNRSSLTIDNGGEKIIQDLKKDAEVYKRYILKQVLTTQTFFKEELLLIVSAEMRTMPDKLLKEVIDHVVEVANTTDKKIVEFLEGIVEYTSDVILSDRSAKVNINDLSWLLNKVKLLVTAAKASDPNVLKAREYSEKLVKASASTKNPTIIASLKTGLILYIVARTFTMRHYSQ